MENNSTLDTAPAAMTTKFINLKQQQCSLNMQIRFAMQIHDAQTQANLEKELEKIKEQIKFVSVHNKEL